MPTTLLALVAAAALGQEPPPAWTTANIAAEAAHVDLVQLPPDARPWQRYVWIPDRAPAAAAAVSYAVNLAANHSRLVQRPSVLADGLLLRWDLRALCPPGTQLEAVQTAWDGLAAGEPYFHQTRPVKVQVKPYVARDGQTYDYRFERAVEIALHAGPNALLSLRTFTGSDCPLVEARWLLGVMLTTVDGGRYYDFRGIQRKPARGTARDAFFESQGVDPKILDNLDPKNKAALFHSGVTGKPRAVVFFYGKNIRPTDGVPVVTFTLDIADGDFDPKKHAVYSLLGAKFDAAEAIGWTPCGLPSYALFDGAGNLVDSAPDTVARDHTIPAPHTARLQPGISCIRCHGPQEGFHPVANDAQDLLRAGLLPQRDSTDTDAASAWETILSQYTGELAEPLRQVRNGHERAAQQATGGLWAEKSAATAAATVSALYGAWAYDPVTAAVACRELGVPLAAGADAVAAFDRAVPRLPADGLGIQLEDPAIAALRAGKSLSRSNWEHVYADCATRRMLGERPRADAE